MLPSFLHFIESLPAVTVLLAALSFLMRLKFPVAQKHQALITGFALVILLPVIQAIIPKWRILPRWKGSPSSIENGTHLAFFETTETFGSIHQALADIPWASILMLIWVVGCIIKCLQITYGTLSLARLMHVSSAIEDTRFIILSQKAKAKLGFVGSVEFRQTEYINLPFAWGWRKPIILFPSTYTAWKADELESALLHELAHIKRQDIVANFFRQAALSLYWFHPMMIRLARQQSLFREMACDDHVILSGKNSTRYAQGLTQLITGLKVETKDRSIASGLGSPSPLRQRLKGILDSGRIRQKANRSDLVYSGTPFLIVGLLITSLSFKVAAEYHYDRYILPNDSALEAQAVFSVYDDIFSPLISDRSHAQHSPTNIEEEKQTINRSGESTSVSASTHPRHRVASFSHPASTASTYKRSLPTPRLDGRFAGYNESIRTPQNPFIPMATGLESRLLLPDNEFTRSKKLTGHEKAAALPKILPKQSEIVPTDLIVGDLEKKELEILLSKQLHTHLYDDLSHSIHPMPDFETGLYFSALDLKETDLSGAIASALSEAIQIGKVPPHGGVGISSIPGDDIAPQALAFGQPFSLPVLEQDLLSIGGLGLDTISFQTLPANGEAQVYIFDLIIAEYRLDSAPQISAVPELKFTAFYLSLAAMVFVCVVRLSRSSFRRVR